MWWDVQQTSVWFCERASLKKVCVGMHSTEWFDGVDLDSEPASSGSTLAPGGSEVPAFPGGAGDALGPSPGPGPEPSGKWSGLLGAHEASAPGIDLVLLRGWPSPAGGCGADRAAKSSCANEAAPDRATEEAGGSGSSACGTDTLPAGVSLAVASAAGERRVHIVTTSVQMHLCLEVRFIFRCREGMVKAHVERRECVLVDRRASSKHTAKPVCHAEWQTS